MARGILKALGTLGSAGAGYLKEVARDPKKAEGLAKTIGGLAGQSTGAPSPVTSVRSLAQKEGTKLAGKLIRNEGGMQDEIARAGRKISSDLQADNEPAISAARAAVRASVPVAQAADGEGNPDAPKRRKRPDPDHFNSGFDESMSYHAFDKRGGSNNGSSD